MKTKKTNRGFSIAEFIDDNGQECSLQKSSSAFKDKIWLGVNDANPKIMSPAGWVQYKFPKEVLFSTRMHLTKKQVKKLLPFLIKFAETGELE